MNDHTTIEELIAVGSLGGLDAGDVAELERLMAGHGPECRECRRLFEQYREVAGRLAFAAAPDELPPGMEDRLVERTAPRAPGSRFGARRMVAAAAAAALLVAGGVGGYLVSPRSSPRTVTISGAAAYYLSRPGIRVTSMRGPGPGMVTLAFRPGASVSYLLGAHLPAVPAGKVYELWLFRGKTPVPATAFTPTGPLTVTRVPIDAATASSAAITIEKAPGVRKPTTPPIFTGPIRSS